MKRLEMLHIMPGDYCNLSCSHCGTLSGPKGTMKLGPKELIEIDRAIREYLPEKLLFTGGEPTFYIELINQIIDFYPKDVDFGVQFTTNGHYAKSEEEIEKYIGAVKKLDEVQISYDKFHGSRLNLDDLKRIKDWCSKNGIKVNISMCISSPLELIEAKKTASESGIKLSYQPVEGSGRAKEMKREYKYYHFEEEVKEKSCPNAGSISYICGKGFSICCSSLMFNMDNKDFYKNDMSSYLNSDFHKKMTTQTFKEMMNSELPEEMDPRLSSPCNFCEYIHS